MDPESEIQDIIDVLSELQEDSTVPKNVRNKISITIASLREKKEVSIRVSKALHELEEVSDDTNIQAYTRTQIWNVVSLLEKLT